MTGAAGQLGQALADCQILFPELKLRLATKAEVDICSTDSINRFLTDNQFYSVINCAAYTAVDHAETNRAAAFDVNSSGASNVAQACHNSNTRLVHISTDYVFDGEKDEPYLETDEVNPINVYGESKAEGESKIAEVMPEATIIRTSWLVSPKGNNFVNTMIRLGNEKDEISVVDDQHASPTWAPLLAKGILQSIQDESDLPGIYHYAHNGLCSWKDFAEFIFQKKDIACEVNPVTTDHFGAPARRPAFSKLDTQKLKNHGGFDFPHWKEATEQYLQSTQ